jgi:hypothetical protein
MPKKITILGANTIKLQTSNAMANRHEYVCANNDVVNGAQAPITLKECYERFPKIKTIADQLGVGTTFSLPPGIGVVGNTSGYCPCAGGCGAGGACGPSGGYMLGASGLSRELAKVKELLSDKWLGCFWPDPYAIFSSNCPDVGDMYETYLKYRLGSATFWNTPIDAPVKRQNFVESVKDLVEITVAGDLSQRPGDIVFLKVDNATGLVTENEDVLPSSSIKSGYYYIMRAKNIIKNDGGHTTILSLTKFLQNRFYPPYATELPYSSLD